MALEPYRARGRSSSRSLKSRYPTPTVSEPWERCAAAHTAEWSRDPPSFPERKGSRTSISGAHHVRQRFGRGTKAPGRARAGTEGRARSFLGAMVVVTVAGKLNDANFQKAKKAAASSLADAEPELSANVVSLLPLDYDLFLPAILPSFPEVKKHAGPVLCYVGEPGVDASYVGDVDAFMSWCSSSTGTRTDAQDLLRAPGQDAHARLPGEGAAGTLQDGRHDRRRARRHPAPRTLHGHRPKACANFMAFAVGDERRDGQAEVRGVPRARVAPGGWFQAGDVLDGNASGSRARTARASRSRTRRSR